jgi:hypothetical protein
MRVPDQLCDCVVFVGRSIRKGSREDDVLLGTAFVVAVQEDRDTRFVYIVTAKHVAYQLSLGSPWFLRVNAKDGESVDLRVEQSGGWWFHPEEPDFVDAAVCVVDAPWDELACAALPVSLFATDEVIGKHNIGRGDLVVITGCFTKMTGRKKNIQLVRTGNIAMMPSEKVPGIEIEEGRPVESEVYLIEARSVGGLSGSPVFVRETVYWTTEVGTDRRLMDVALPGAFHLLGLAHGHWDVKEEEINEVQIRATDKGDRRGVNVGIAVVVPAKKILDILNRPELAGPRQEWLCEKMAKTGTTIPDLGDSPQSAS